MKQKSASKLFHEVDPELTVISGGNHKNRRGKKAVKLDEVSRIELPPYTPHTANNDDWDNAGGTICPICRQETVRLIPFGLTGKHKRCPACMERRRRLLEFKRRLREMHRQVSLPGSGNHVPTS